MKINLLLLFSVILFSCTPTENKNFPFLKNFGQKHKLVSDVININNKQFGRPEKILCIDSLMVVFDIYDNYFLSLVDVKNKKFLKRFGKIGKGPDELIRPFSLQTTNNYNGIEVFDVMLNTLFFFNLDSVVSNDFYSPKIYFQNSSKKIRYFKIVRTDSLIVGNGIWEGGRYAFSKPNGKLLGRKYNYPDDDTNYSDMVKAMAYQGKIVLNPSKKQFVFGISNCAGLEIFKIKNDEIFKIKEIYYYYPDYRLPDLPSGGYSAAISGDNKMGFIDICVTKKFIYALFSGKSYNEFEMEAFKGNIILVYDWNGNQIKYYELDKSIKCIGVSANDMDLYGIYENPDPILINYNLKGTF